MTSTSIMIHGHGSDINRLKVLKYIRFCAMLAASTEMIIGAVAVASNLGIFTYYLAEASKGSRLKNPEFFFESVLDPNLHISAKTFSKIAAFMFVYSVVHFVASVFLFKELKLHEKCRWSFMINICLWTIGIFTLLAPLNDRSVLCLFITIFSLKIAELALIKRFMDELQLQGYGG